MDCRKFAFLAAASVSLTASPAAAQDAPHPPPAWDDPQAPRFPGLPPLPAPPFDPDHHPAPDRDYPGAPYAYPMPPGDYHDGADPYRDGIEPHPNGPMGWRGGPDPRYGYGYQYGSGAGYGYQEGYGPVPCGCAGYALPPVTWVPVPIQTRYIYSPPIRREKVIVKVTEQKEVIETRPAPVQVTKYVKAAPTKYVKSAPAKYTKGKVVHTTK